jgi:COMM domain containing 9
MHPLAPLELLLKAKSKKVVDELLTRSYLKRNESLSIEFISSASETLGISYTEAESLLKAARSLTCEVVFNSLDESDIVALFPSGFNTDLSGLLSSLLAARLGEWTDIAEQTQLSGPKLLDMDWRVDIKSGSGEVGKMHVPTLLVSMNVEEPFQSGGASQSSHLQFELDRETLGTLLDGLTKIREQLSSVATSAAATSS